MRFRHFVPILLALPLAACAGGRERESTYNRAEAQAVDPTPAAPDVYVMRHLEKGEGADPGLTPEGLRHAEDLLAFFAADPPKAIYVSTTRRARETATPLASTLGLPLKTYDPADTTRLIAEVAREPGPVLIIGHSNTVPEIVEKLGGARPEPLSESEFGDVWHVAGSDHRVEKRRLAQ